MPFITQKFESMQYDGTNGAGIAEWLVDASFVSDDGETLTLEVPGWPNPDQRQVPKGYYVLCSGGRTFSQAIPAESYLRDWTEIPPLPTP